MIFVSSAEKDLSKSYGFENGFSTVVSNQIESNRIESNQIDRNSLFSLISIIKGLNYAEAKQNPYEIDKSTVRFNWLLSHVLIRLGAYCSPQIHTYIYIYIFFIQKLAKISKHNVNSKMNINIGWSLLLRRIRNNDKKIGSWLCLHNGNVWAIYGIHSSMDWMYDCSTMFASNCCPYIQYIRSEAVLSGLYTTRRFSTLVGRLLYT